jgi:23S rRNA (adenine2503-C2)-methyltransferase
MNAPWGPGVGARRITVSTVGLVDRIRRLAGEGLELELAISLHGPNDETRLRLCPNARAGVSALLKAARAYYRTTGRVVTFEYALVGGVNDSPEHALELARRLTGLPTKVNLIPLNHVPDAGLSPPTSASVRSFLDVLVRNGIISTVRRERGAEVDAACGQLRWRRMTGTGNAAASRNPGGR